MVNMDITNVRNTILELVSCEILDTSIVESILNQLNRCTYEIMDTIFVNVNLQNLQNLGFRLALRYSRRLDKNVISLYTIKELQTTPNITMCSFLMSRIMLSELIDQFDHHLTAKVGWKSF